VDNVRGLIFAVFVWSAGVSVAGAASDSESADSGDHTPTIVGETAADRPHPGEDLYRSMCASCHEGAVQKAPHTQMLGLLTPQAIVRSLTNGVMQEQGQGLTQAQHVQIAEYLSSRPLNAASRFPPPVCSAANKRFDAARAPRGHGWGFAKTNARFLSPQTAQVDRDRLDRLRIKWAFAFPGANRVRSQPAIGGGALYVGSHNGKVYALDQRSGCIRWTLETGSEVRTGIVLQPWSEADETVRPKIFFGDILGNVYAVDATNGTLVWKRRADDHPHATITAAPAYHDGRLFVSVSSLEVVPAADPAYECCKSRGSVVAYDAATGDVLWQTYSVRELPRLQGKNPSGTDQYGPSGASIWNSPTIDVARDQLYVGTGENMSSPATDTSDAILALDLATGRMNWVFQATQGDAWNVACTVETRDNCPVENGPDYDFGASPILVSLDGNRELVVAGQKSGVVHALDPDTGALAWQTKVGRGGVQGGIHFGMAARDGIIYVPISDLEDGRSYAEPARPGLYALEGATGEMLWSHGYPDLCAGREFCHPGISAAITVAGDMVFAGGMDGILRVHDITDGNLLTSIDTAREYVTLSGETGYGGSIGGGAGPVVADGMVYISSGYGIYLHMSGNVLVAYGAD